MSMLRAPKQKVWNYIFSKCSKRTKPPSKFKTYHTCDVKRKTRSTVEHIMITYSKYTIYYG